MFVKWELDSSGSAVEIFNKPKIMLKVGFNLPGAWLVGRLWAEKGAITLRVMAKEERKSSSRPQLLRYV